MSRDNSKLLNPMFSNQNKSWYRCIDLEYIEYPKNYTCINKWWPILSIEIDCLRYNRFVQKLDFRMTRWFKISSDNKIGVVWVICYWRCSIYIIYTSESIISLYIIRSWARGQCQDSHLNRPYNYINKA